MICQDTLPVDLIPRTMHSQQRTQTDSRLRLTVQLILPPSSIELEISRVERYQKYDVGLLLLHSATTSSIVWFPWWKNEVSDKFHSSQGDRKNMDRSFDWQIEGWRFNSQKRSEPGPHLLVLRAAERCKNWRCMTAHARNRTGAWRRRRVFPASTFLLHFRVEPLLRLSFRSTSPTCDFGPQSNVKLNLNVLTSAY